MKVLFDADILVFRCAFASEYRVWFLKVGDNEHEYRYKKEAEAALDTLCPGKYSRTEGEDYTMWSEVVLEPLGNAIQNLNTLVGSILETLGQTEFDIEMMLSPYHSTNFRYDIAKTLPYKGNRDRTHRPTYEADLRNYIIENWASTVAVHEEADDLLGIAQTKIGVDSVVVSLDKDLDQIPGLKYNFVQQRSYDITPKQGMHNFHIQLLMGDTSDNIPGLPGIGIGKARKILHGIEGEAEQLLECCRQYQIHSGKEDWITYMREQGDLLWIRRYPGEIWSSIVTIEQEDISWDSQNLTLY